MTVFELLILVVLLAVVYYTPIEARAKNLLLIVLVVFLVLGVVLSFGSGFLGFHRA